MLKQILQDMWVHPDILAELDEGQKQTLFCRMREEQVRRWKIWDQQLIARPPLSSGTVKRSNKQVQFLLDEEGEPWTWVMGEHPDDPSIETILEREAREAARRLAETELRLSVEAELTELLDLNQKQLAAMEAAQQGHEDIYCSVADVRDRGKVSMASTPRDALQEISLNKTNQSHKVSQRVAMWEKRVMEERTSQIYKGIQKKKMEAAKEAEEAEQKREQLWKEQEKKAKEAELKIREIARLAREEHRRTSVMDVEMEIPPQQSPDSPTKGLTAEQLEIGGPKPPSKDAIVEWFRSSELARRAGLESDRNVVAPWFHGLISRTEAETLLNRQPVGCFLVRVSERIWGYAISYRDSDRCKHYLVDASNGHYQFLGTNQMAHSSLGELIDYHQREPITVLGGERLLLPCSRKEPLPAILQGLGLPEQFPHSR